MSPQLRHIDKSDAPSPDLISSSIKDDKSPYDLPEPTNSTSPKLHVDNQNKSIDLKENFKKDINQGNMKLQWAPKPLLNEGILI